MKLKLFTIFFLITICLAQPVAAAQLYFKSTTSEPAVSTNWQVSFWLDTAGEQINALEGTISFPSQLLELNNINNGSSIINFWLEDPYQISPGQIKFSGIIPGGFNGQAQIFTINFRPQNEAADTIRLSETKLLLNDGQGAELPTTNLNFHFQITQPQNPPEIVIDVSDQYPPENFVPILTKVPEIAGNKYLLIFSTQDKASGIDYYEIKESFWPAKKIQSPYILKDQSLSSTITIRAVDKAGNVRTVKIPPTNPSNFKFLLKFAIILIIIILIWFLAIKLLWKNKKQN